MTCPLDLAKQSKNLRNIIVIGADQHNKIQLFTAQADRNHLIVQLERAKLALIRQLELGS